MTTATRRSRRVAVAVGAALVTVTLTGVANAAGWTVLAAAGATAASHSLLPVPPSGVTATCTAPNTAKTITVTWTAVAHATYVIYQSTTSATAGYSAVATTAAPSWTSGNLSSGLTYWYEVSSLIGGSWLSARSAATAGHAIRSSAPLCS